MRRWSQAEIPLLVALCVAGVLLPWGGSKTWIAAADWAASHGLGGLEGGSRLVTALAAAVAVLGAAMRMGAARLGTAKGLAACGLYFTVAPLCLLMPVTGALCFLAASAGLAGAEWRAAVEQSPRNWWAVLLRESFSILSAGCFAVLGWQYNAQLLERGLLVTAGLALVARAALPGTGERRG